MVSFYRPQGKRTKLICEAKAFPSDQYALESQVKFHGLDLNENLIEIAPREGEHLIREEDILAKIAEVGDELALVMIGGVNYYSGQLFDMKSITEAAHKVGAIAGFDLAHAAGNINLKLQNEEILVRLEIYSMHLFFFSRIFIGLLFFAPVIFTSIKSTKL